MSSRRTTDVMVIGAGPAGLTAALELVAAGTSVAVLEARDRVGGRLLDHDLGDGHVKEIGRQFVGPTQDHILALAQEVGVGTYQAVVPRETLYVHDGKAKRFSGHTPPDLLALPDMRIALARIAKDRGASAALSSTSRLTAVGAPGRPLTGEAAECELSVGPM